MLKHLNELLIWAGAYSALLAIRAIKEFAGSGFDEMTFSTAMNFKFDGIEAEVDFVAGRRKEKYDGHESPNLIIGEAKSIGKGDLIKPKDLSKLKLVGKKLPGTIIVISVLRDDFTKNEKKILKKFIQWARRPNHRGQPTNPVIILLTSHELFMRHNISDTWGSLGDPHKSFSDFHYTRTLPIFAEATQSIYLGMRSSYDDKAEKRKKRLEKTKEKTSSARAATLKKGNQK